MKNIKIVPCLVVISAFYTMQLWSHPAKPRLTDPILKWLDNKPFALDCAAMGDILHVRREIRKMQFGIQNPAMKKFVGFYMYDGELRTLRWLSDHEKLMTKEFMDQRELLEKKYLNYEPYNAELRRSVGIIDHIYETRMNEQHEVLKRSYFDTDDYEYQITRLKKELMQEHENALCIKEEEIKLKHVINRDLYQSELQVLTEAYHAKLQTLASCLKKAMEDFLTATQPFVIKMEGTKTMILKLVVEFCVKYRRPRSFLLELAKIEEGQEIALFQNLMVSCKALDEACVDLADFLEALYYSCEKARAEFEAREKAKHKK